MDDILGKMVAILLAAFVFAGIPVIYMRERAKTAEQMYLLSMVTEFVDSMCNVGFVDYTMYRQFLQEVAAASGLYQVQILHEQKELLYSDGEYSYVSTYYDEEDMIEQLLVGECYQFAQGDYVKVTILQEKGSFHLPGIQDATMNLFYGGTVRYATY